MKKKISIFLPLIVLFFSLFTVTGVLAVTTTTCPVVYDIHAIESMARPSYSKNDAAVTLNLGLINPAGGFVFRSGIDFDVSAIPRNASITEIKLNLYWSRIPRLGDTQRPPDTSFFVKEQSARANNGTAEEIFDRFGQGTVYVEKIIQQDLSLGPASYKLKSASYSKMQSSINSQDQIFTISLTTSENGDVVQYPNGVVSSEGAGQCFRVSPTLTVTYEEPTQPSNNVSGWAWSENIGWISFNSVSDGGSIDYGVSIDPNTGVFSGYAWSENIGWISFNSSDLTGCPSGTCLAKLNLSDYEISGWARALAPVGQPLEKTGGWEGWIRLRDTKYGVYINKTANAEGVQEFRKYAWGGGNTMAEAVVGWISFNCLDADIDAGVCGISNYKVVVDLAISPRNKLPRAKISCNPSSCTVFYGDPLILNNDSTDDNGQEDIVRSEWCVKKQGTSDSTYEPKPSCTTDPILCNYTPQAEITPGAYTAQLYVKDAAGESDIALKNFWIKRDINADFECSLDGDDWATPCEEIKPIVRDTIYFQDISGVSQGATEIISWSWKENGNLFDTIPNPSTNAIAGPMKIELTVFDGQREGSITRIISVERINPKWQEIPPF